MTEQTTPRKCPFPHDLNPRKTTFSQTQQEPAIERQGDLWHLRSYAAVRQVLRDAQRVRQGLEANTPVKTQDHQPVVFQDGDVHREQRTAIARFFTPKTVNETHHTLIEHITGHLIHRLMRDGKADLSQLSMELAVEVAGRIVGLTDSYRGGMDRRLDSLLSMEDLKALPLVKRTVKLLGTQRHMLDFYLTDLRPAIQKRKKDPQDDVISHLLSKKYNDMELMIEALTYASAGMATTREFICMAAWHFLENEPLRQSYLTADRNQRHQMLHEILRLEPVASTLWRKAAEDLTIEHEGFTHHIPAGAHMVLDIKAANADAAAVGTDPLGLCPHRDLSSGVQPQALSFGDGAHRCPGAFLAIHESDVFLQKLLRLPLKMVGAPELTFNEFLKSYEIRDFQVALVIGAQSSG